MTPPAEAVRPSPRRVVGALLLALALVGGACAGADVPPSTGVTDATIAGDDVADAAPDPSALVPLTPAPTPTLPVTVPSAEGAEVEVRDASRIVPLNGSLAEIVFSLGLGDAVVGRDATTTFADAADLPEVSTGHDVSAEGVLSLRPSVVLADTRTGPPESIDQIRSAGVPVVVFDEAWTLADVVPRILAVATALGVPDAGRALADRTTAEVAAAADSVAVDASEGPLRVAFLYVRGSAGIYLLGGEGSGADAMLEALGAVDVGSEQGLGPFTPLTSEALIAAQPDVLLVMDEGLQSVGGVDGLVDLPGVAQTPAGRNRRVVAVDDGLLLNFGPRTGAALHVLADALYEDAP